MEASEVVDWPPLWHHTPICLSRQAPLLEAISLGAPRLGLGWYGHYNGVQSIADHLKSLHTCPKWMDNAFYGGGFPYFGRLIQYYWLDNGNFGSNEGVMLGRHYGAVAASQGHGVTPNPSESLVCVPE